MSVPVVTCCDGDCSCSPAAPHEGAGDRDDVDDETEIHSDRGDGSDDERLTVSHYESEGKGLTRMDFRVRKRSKGLLHVTPDVQSGSLLRLPRLATLTEGRARTREEQTAAVLNPPVHKIGQPLRENVGSQPCQDESRDDPEAL